MGPKGSIKPLRANVEMWECFATFLVAADGSMAIEYGDGMSVTEDDTGEYTISFTEWGPGPLVDLDIRCWSAADDEPWIAKPVVGSYDGSVGEAQFEVWDIDETEAKVSPAENDRVVIVARFLKTV